MKERLFRENPIILIFPLSPDPLKPNKSHFRLHHPANGSGFEVEVLHIPDILNYFMRIHGKSINDVT